MSDVRCSVSRISAVVNYTSVSTTYFIRYVLLRTCQGRKVNVYRSLDRSAWLDTDTAFTIACIAQRVIQLYSVCRDFPCGFVIFRQHLPMTLCDKDDVDHDSRNRKDERILILVPALLCTLLETEEESF